MNLHEHIDIYCERVDIAFWSEPINAITNLAFIVASLMALNIYRKEKITSYPFVILALLVFFIGVGSFLFHTFANTWSSLADTIPIWSFVLLYVLFSIRYIFNNNWLKTLRTMVIVFILVYIGFTLSQSDSGGEVPLNGSIQYAPALFIMMVFSVALYLKRTGLAKYAFYAVAVFMVSLMFRTVDMSICSSFSIGTHFLWHILNALMLYLLLLIMLKAELQNKGYTN